MLVAGAIIGQISLRYVAGVNERLEGQETQAPHCGMGGSVVGHEATLLNHLPGHPDRLFFHNTGQA